MARKTMLALLAQADATLATNGAQAITAEDVRSMVKDFIDSISPGYAAVQVASQVLALTGTPVVIGPFSGTIALTSEFTIPAPGTVRRVLAPLPSTVTRITMTGDISGGNNNEVILQLYKNGVAVGGGIVVSTRGANLAGIAFSTINSEAAVDADYTVRASTTSNGNYTFQNITFVYEVVPTIGI